MKQLHVSILVLAPLLGFLLWQTQPSAGTAAPPTFPTAKVAVIDSAEFASEKGIQQVLQQLKLIDEKYRPSFEELQKLQREVEALQEEIRTKSPNWTVEIQRQKQEDLEGKQLRGKRMSEDLQRDFQKDRQRATAPISERVRTHLQQYAGRRGISLLIDAAPLEQAGAILFLDSAIDITREFIDDYNKAYPVPQTSGTTPSPK